MTLKLGGADPAKIMVGSAPASKVMSGGVVAWQAVRKVTITGDASGFISGSEIGDTDLIDAWSSRRVVFAVDVTCDRDTSIFFGSNIPAGGIISAGQNIVAAATGTAGVYVFTEVTS